MGFDPQALSDREKAILRLLAQGHDAKSAARQLGISVHAVNERLRTARRKLEVSSSREAGRLLARSERQNSNLLVDKKIEVAVPESDDHGQSQKSKAGKHGIALAVGGICFVSLLIIIATLATAPSETAASGPLPNWTLQAALPGKLPRQSNRIYLGGNRLLWNGEEVKEANIRTFLTVEAQMSPQPATILSYGSQVVPGRIERIRQLIDGALRCTPATCFEITTPVEDDGSAPQVSQENSKHR